MTRRYCDFSSRRMDANLRDRLRVISKLHPTERTIHDVMNRALEIGLEVMYQEAAAMKQLKAARRR